MINKIFLILFTLLLSLYTLNANSVQIKIITISGSIDETLYQRFLKLNLSNDFSAIPAGLIVFLDSPGGDVDIAIKMGKILRNFNAQIFVTKKCASACVLIFASGVVRDAPELSLGIHRFSINSYDVKLKKNIPVYLSKASSDYSLIIYKRINSYLKEMNIDTSLLKKMEETDPNNISWLSRLDAKRYNLIGYDDNYIYSKVESLQLFENISSSSYKIIINQISNNCVLNSKFIQNQFINCYKKLLINKN